MFSKDTDPADLSDDDLFDLFEKTHPESFGWFVEHNIHPARDGGPYMESCVAVRWFDHLKTGSHCAFEVKPEDLDPLLHGETVKEAMFVARRAAILTCFQFEKRIGITPTGEPPEKR